MVGVDGSCPFAPTKFGRGNKHLAETPGAFFLVVRKNGRPWWAACPPDVLEEAICRELIASAQRPVELPVQ